MRVVANKVKRITGFNPTDVEVVTSQDVILDFDPEVPVIKVARKVHWTFAVRRNEYGNFMFDVYSKKCTEYCK